MFVPNDTYNINYNSKKMELTKMFNNKGLVKKIMTSTQ